jgi:hypothetical protein
MPLPLITDCIRCSIRWQAPSCTDELINVLHFFNSPADPPGVIDATLQSEWAALVGPVINVDWLGIDVTYTQLNGSASEVIPWTAGNGANGTGAVGTNIAMVHSWRTALAGRAHRGRSYVGGLAGAQVDPTKQNVWSASTISSATARQATFITNMVTSGHYLVVASYLHSSFERVTRGVLSPKLGTQRKRANGR